MDVCTFHSYAETFNDLKLVQVIGEGTFGVVHKAIWRGTVVAAKVINMPCGSKSGWEKEFDMCRQVATSLVLSVQ